MSGLAYISISFAQRQSLEPALKAITNALHPFGIRQFVFVDNYQFDKTQQHQMMQQAFDDIDKADMLIAETSDKAIGIGVEVGYAKAKGKIIIYLRHKEAPHSTTVAGTSDYQIVYTNPADLGEQMKNVLAIIFGEKNL